MIDPKAVEAAARAFAAAAGEDYCFEHVDDWENRPKHSPAYSDDEFPELSYQACEEFRDQARAALEAAAPILQAAILREFASSFASAGFRTHDTGWDNRTIANAAEYAEAMAEELDPQEDPS